jgi:chromosome segregation ATPase
MDFDHDKQHNFSPLEQAAQSMRKDLKKNCEILERTVANSDRETRVLKEDIQSLSNNFTMTQRLINERKQQLLTKVHNTVETKTNTMIGDARQIFDGKKKNIEEEIHEKEAFFKRVKVSAEMARSLLENGDDEEIVRSYQSVQENVNNATETEGNRPSYHVDALSWSSDEIDKMLLAEVKVIVEDKGIIKIVMVTPFDPQHI